MSLGTFSLVKNESRWIAAHILRVLLYVDEMVLFDGDSTDGTIEIIEAIQKEHTQGYKIKLYKHRDPKDLAEDYVRMSDECMKSLSTDLAWFLHPDMFVLNPDQILKARQSKAVALSCRMRSFAGEPDGELMEIVGRADAWKNIYRLKNPDLGAHYFGKYGEVVEDVYFREITGDTHERFLKIDQYPYAVEDSGIEVLHFSDVRPHARRLDRMVKCFLNQGGTLKEATEQAARHPRVTLKDGGDFTFVPAQYPPAMVAMNASYSHHRKEIALV